MFPALAFAQVLLYALEEARVIHVMPTHTVRLLHLLRYVPIILALAVFHTMIAHLPSQFVTTMNVQR